ncbi:hypothetical protein ACFXB3_11345 [Streptomyces sp. NPDC059447]|uniref:hypothetical protein n=1 Tax=Streptomyces sp. NPDC059447 TaxID=3346834 RepID=UPI003695943C
MVLGSRGRGGLASPLLGSNGLACASRAACPWSSYRAPTRRRHRTRTVWSYSA